jgi:hypothetical protein
MMPPVTPTMMMRRRDNDAEREDEPAVIREPDEDE